MYAASSVDFLTHNFSECQIWSSIPRKWQKSNWIRGCALAKEKFQFVFMHKHDLQKVFDKDMQTYDDWGLAIERWIEKPLPG